MVVNGNGLWVGWPGIHLDDPNEPIPESDPNDITPTAGLKSKKVSQTVLIFSVNKTLQLITFSYFINESDLEDIFE